MMPTSATSTRGSSRSKGHTLAELLVVLAILSALALFAIPRFVSTMLQSRLDRALAQVRDDLGFAKTRATATGVRHQVIVNQQTGEMLVLPYRPEEETTTANAVQAEPEPALRSRLPEEIRFAEWNVAPLGYQSGQTATPAAQQDLQPLIFYPENQSDSAVVVLESQDGRRVGLTVDSFTGEIRDLTPEELGRS